MVLHKVRVDRHAHEWVARVLAEETAEAAGALHPGGDQSGLPETGDPLNVSTRTAVSSAGARMPADGPAE